MLFHLSFLLFLSIIANALGMGKICPANSHVTRDARPEDTWRMGPVLRSSSPFVPSVPQECLRTGICEDLPDYPEDQVAALIQKLGPAMDKYKVGDQDCTTNCTQEIAQTRAGDPEDIELCEFSLRNVVPKAAPDEDGKWHYIINLKKRPMQGFRVEICKNAGAPCSKIAHFYTGYEPCKQKYMLRYMAGLDANGEMVEKNFKIPSCCNCVARQTDVK